VFGEYGYHFSSSTEIERGDDHFIFPKSYAMTLTAAVSINERKLITRKKFSPDEDEQIARLVDKYGAKNWDQIAAELGTDRTKRQLRERWNQYLNPDLEPGYTQEEDDLLCRLVDEHGRQWAKIASLIQRKSSISTRNRHRFLETLRARGMRPKCDQTPVQEAVVWDDTIDAEGDLDQSFFNGDAWFF
jgi:hypothetical protein